MPHGASKPPGLMKFFSRPLISTLLVVAVLALLALDVGRRMVLDTSMEQFLPGGQERALYRVSRKVIDSTLTRRMVITLGAESSEISREKRRDSLAQDALALRTALVEVPGVGDLTSAPPTGIAEEVFELYFPRRFAFFSLAPKADHDAFFSDEALKRSAHSLKERLASPEGMLIRTVAPKDPWLLFPRILDDLEQSGFALDVHAGQFFASPEAAGPNRDWAVLFVELEQSALDADAQEPLLAALERAVADVRAKSPLHLIVEVSGANRFAVSTQKSMKGDIERVFTLSTLGLLLLFLALFRSMRRVFFLALPIGAGLVVASWISLVLYERLHALTLAFGGALIGVAIDYPVHMLCHHDLDEAGQSPAHTVRRLRGTLSLAAGTTVIGLLGLAWTAFPGIREIAVFTGSGVFAALACTVLVSPGLLPASGQGSSLSRRLADILASCLDRLRARRGAGWALLGLACGLSAWGLFHVRFAPGLDSLAPLDPKLLAEDARVQARIGEPDGGKLAISLATSLERALVQNEELTRRLTSESAREFVGGVTSPSLFLRSNQLQRTSHAVVVNTKDLARRTRAALAGAGFVPEAFVDLEKELERPFSPLEYADLKKSKLEPLIEPFVLPLEGEWAVISPLRDVKDEGALERAIEQVEGTSYFSQRTMLNRAYEDLRSRTTRLLLIGLALVALAAFARYRGVRRTIAAVIPSILAAGATIGTLTLLGQELNLLHLLGLLLVCSMGVDYGVFLVDSKPTKEGPAMLSITVGCLSTMCSFGALSLSTAPALRALGSTIAIGVMLSLILAPIAFLLLSPTDRQEKIA